MAFRKKSLRRMSPTARKVARLAGELDSVSRRLKNLIPDFQLLDADSQALQTARQISFSDSDLWGLESALNHGLQDGYLLDNKEWVEAILERIGQLRKRPEEDLEDPMPDSSGNLTLLPNEDTRIERPE